MKVPLTDINHAEHFAQCQINNENCEKLTKGRGFLKLLEKGGFSFY